MTTSWLGRIMIVGFMPYSSKFKAVRLFLLRLALQKHCEINNVGVGTSSALFCSWYKCWNLVSLLGK